MSATEDADDDGTWTRHDTLAAAFDLADDSSTDEVSVADKAPTCRLCYEPRLTTDNPLLSVCACNGTLKFIHLRCLKVCLQYRLQLRRDPASISYYWSSFECDLCKTMYPSTTKVYSNARRSGES
jgi:E3 ubiquitin-protein ligase DOA10